MKGYFRRNCLLPNGKVGASLSLYAFVLCVTTRTCSLALLYLPGAIPQGLGTNCRFPLALFMTFLPSFPSPMRMPAEFITTSTFAARVQLQRGTCKSCLPSINFLLPASSCAAVYREGVSTSSAFDCWNRLLPPSARNLLSPSASGEARVVQRRR